MSKWKEYKLGDLITLEYGKSLNDYRESHGKYPVYGTNVIIGNSDLFLSPIPSVIVGRKGAYRGIHYSRYPFFVIDTAFYVKPKVYGIDLLFLNNFLITQDINNMDSGSAIPSTDRYEIYDIPILLLPLPDQKAIAEMLSSLDDKIDLLQYQNNLLTTAEIIEELLNIARNIREVDGLAEKLNLSKDEFAFYTALGVNDSAVKIMGDDILKAIAKEIAEKVRQNTTIDWEMKESARAKLIVLVRRTLKKYDYPPDKEKIAIDTVMKQAEAMADFWVQQ